MRILITALAIVMTISTPSQADYVGDYETAEAQGYVPVDWSYEYDDTASMLDQQLVQPWLAKNMPGASASFSYATPDINGDGFAITLVAYRFGQSLILVGEAMTLDVGLRRLPSGEQEVAFIDFEGIRGIGD